MIEKERIGFERKNINKHKPQHYPRNFILAKILMHIIEPKCNVIMMLYCCSATILTTWRKLRINSQQSTLSAIIAAVTAVAPIGALFTAIHGTNKRKTANYVINSVHALHSNNKNKNRFYFPSNEIDNICAVDIRYSIIWLATKHQHQHIISKHFPQFFLAFQPIFLIISECKHFHILFI